MAMSRNSQRGGSHIALAIIAAFVALALVVAAIIVWPRVSMRFQQPDDGANIAHSDAVVTPTHEPLSREASPAPDLSSEAKARRAVAAMSMDERVGQLVMAPLYAGSDPSVLWDLIANQHVGSVLIIGNWNDGVSSVRSATDAMQSYAPQSNRLLMTTDQEGGLVQHLRGPGFDAMPSAVEQGMMDVDQLRRSAAVWGAQLAQAGINVDLAPVLGTVTIDRMVNEPIGMLDRDFGLDADGNAWHGIAFIQGMRDAGIATSVKHYPGLGSVNGNTDFTADGILDVTTTLDGAEIGAFDTAIEQSDPGMVMMSLATYQAIDPNNPAVFSSTLIDGHLRGDLGYEGVVTSDSMSATALSGFSPDELGVRMVAAGGDLACVGALDYVQPILDGLKRRAASDPEFADKVTRSAQRVMTLKYEMGLAVES
ncbi:glycoside hydrolase family 3 N-terminal domain-containing protein [Bifidobacterium eulemuris]|uniref:beta-N-acetylhexosaminidase n=2 Tax=Bifidobacterium eulemuris TaxID=1765219 RepID=A0A261GBX8_9BIFI|nr:glycoside hydrolase family 3 N-terminal domain-containing protein [Bifidobacterium eulemuris]OZG68937.1 beta-glucosidase [Bifidobacterium eulemuris]QOL31527.1 glycoside hydrolase family 3 protein [Bifidobacterium eulemuris]